MRNWVPESGVELHSGDVFICEPDWSWSVRNLRDLDLWYVMEGAGWISDGETRTPIGSGDYVLLRRGASYEAGHHSQRPLKLIALHFDPRDPANLSTRNSLLKINDTW